MWGKEEEGKEEGMDPAVAATIAAKPSFSSNHSSSSSSISSSSTAAASSGGEELMTEELIMEENDKNDYIDEEKPLEELQLQNKFSKIKLNDLKEELKRLTSRLSDKIFLIEESKPLFEAEAKRIDDEKERIIKLVEEKFSDIRNEINIYENELYDKINKSFNENEIHDLVAYANVSSEDNRDLLSIIDTLFESTDCEQIEKYINRAKKVNSIYREVERILKHKKKYIYELKVNNEVKIRDVLEKKYELCISKDSPQTLLPPQNFQRISNEEFSWDLPSLDLREDESMALIVVNNDKEVIYKDCVAGNTKVLCLDDIDTKRAYNLRLKVGYKLCWSELSNNAIINPDTINDEKPFNNDRVIDYKWKKLPPGMDKKRLYSVQDETSYTVRNISNYICTAITTNSFPEKAVSNISFCINEMKKKGRSMFIGISQEGIDQKAENNYAQSGWYVHCFDGRLYSGYPHYYRFPGRKYLEESGDGASRLKEGSNVTMKVDTNMGMLSFKFDQKDLGIAYAGIPLDKPLYPTVILSSRGDSIQITEFF